MANACSIHRGAKAYTLIEVLVVSAIMSFVMAGVYNIFRHISKKGAVKISQKLTLQIEARRALLNLYSEVQEGIEMLKPDPGSTLPFAVLRDGVNNVHFLFLKKDEQASIRQKKSMFRLYSVVYDIEKASSGPAHELLKGIEKLSFTSHGYGTLFVSSTLREGRETFSFMNLIRLKNLAAEEGA